MNVFIHSSSGINRSRRKFLGRSSSLAFGLLLLSPIPRLSSVRYGSRRTLVRRASFTMGTVVEATVYGETRSQCDAAIDLVFEEFDRCDRLMSVFRPESQISLLNRNAGKSAVKVDRSIIEILQDAETMSRRTGGAFDVTVEPLMELWGFRPDSHPGARPRTLPSDRVIAETLEAVGHRNIVLDVDQEMVGLLHPKARLDLGGIAVGYSLDRAAEILRSEGIQHALIMHSGDIVALGSPPEDEAWKVGIADPSEPGRPITSVQLRDAALSTSGNYQNFVEFDGRRYGHLVDPKTGYPGESVLSTTVISSRATDADGLSTAAFLLGPGKTEHVLSECNYVEVITVAILNGKPELLRQRSPTDPLQGVH